MGDVHEKALSWETVKINTEGPLEEIRGTQRVMKFVTENLSGNFKHW